ncbi:MAG: hypothetical protein VB049_04795 [Candidatus Pelethousia sp.]|nr:hypothetical protein [Candidatus Pelethousia sp.]
MALLYGLVLKLSVIAVLRCVLAFLLPSGSMKRSAGRAMDLIMFWMVAEVVLSTWQEVL